MNTNRTVQYERIDDTQQPIVSKRVSDDSVDVASQQTNGNNGEKSKGRD